MRPSVSTTATVEYGYGASAAGVGVTVWTQPAHMLGVRRRIVFDPSPSSSLSLSQILTPSGPRVCVLVNIGLFPSHLAVAISQSRNNLSSRIGCNPTPDPTAAAARVLG
jgi:hypothetical protein